MSTHDLDRMAAQVADNAIIAGLWVGQYYTSEDAEPEPLDDHADPSDLTESATAWVRAECRGFLGMVDDAGLLDDYLSRHDSEDEALAQMGHDLVLTSQHHGAGFWDRGLGDLGDKLTELAHTYSDDHFSFSGYGSSEIIVGEG